MKEGSHLSEEHRRKISKALTGRKGVNTGRVLSEEWKRNISKAMKGRKGNNRKKAQICRYCGKCITGDRGEHLKKEHRITNWNNSRVCDHYVTKLEKLGFLKESPVRKESIILSKDGEVEGKVEFIEDKRGNSARVERKADGRLVVIERNPRYH